MHWSHGWGLVGQIVVCCIVVAVVVAPFIRRYLRRVRKTTTVRLPRDPMKYEMRDLTPEQRRAVIASDSRWTENEFQQNARRAESLGFLDDVDEPRRSA